MGTFLVGRLFVRNFTVVAAATLLTGVLLIAAQAAGAQTDASASISLPRIRQSQAAGDEETQNKSLRARRGPFATGQWLLTAYGSAAVGKTSHQVYAGHVGLGYYLIDNLSLNLEGVGYFVDHARNSGGGGVDLLPRWHYLAQDNWSLYLDGGWGFVYTSDTLRDPGTHFNFTLQGGAGATYNVTDRLTAMLGGRWYHISNARIRGRDRNVGFDSPLFYLGLMMPL
jgi:opacity protein-like surface antigen